MDEFKRTRRPVIPPVQRHRDRKNDYRRTWPFPVLDEVREVRHVRHAKPDPNDFDPSPM